MRDEFVRTMNAYRATGGDVAGILAASDAGRELADLGRVLSPARSRSRPDQEKRRSRNRHFSAAALQHSNLTMTDLTTFGPPLGLQATDDDMSPEQRCSIGIRNIELLCDLDWRGRLLLALN